MARNRDVQCAKCGHFYIRLAAGAVCPSCDSPRIVRAQPVPLRYVPKVGDLVRVKSTTITRKYGVGLSVPSWGSKSDCVAWPGDVGRVVSYQGGPAGQQWTGYRMEFARGRNYHLTSEDNGQPGYFRPDDAEYFVRLTPAEVTRLWTGGLRA